MIPGPSRGADGQAEHSRIGAIRLVEKALAAQFTLRCVFAHIFIRQLRPFAQAYSGKVKILSIRTDDDRIRTHLLNAIDAMSQRKLMHISARPAHCVQLGMTRSVGISPAAAGAIKKIIADKTVLQSVTLSF